MTSIHPSINQSLGEAVLVLFLGDATGVMNNSFANTHKAHQEHEASYSFVF